MPKDTRQLNNKVVDTITQILIKKLPPNEIDIFLKILKDDDCNKIQL